MGRTSSVDIDTAPKRARLPARRNPFWQGIGGGRGGVSVGYRKPAEGAGSWIAKIVLNGRRFEERIGVADDDGSPAGAIPYRLAVASALEWANRQAATIRADNPTDESLVPTVRTAVEHYGRLRIKKSPVAGKVADGRLRLHVLSDSKFSDTPLSKLRARTIEEWRERLPVLHEEDPERPGGIRPRPMSPSTVNRLLNEVRAALNAAAERHRRELPAQLGAEIKIGTRALSLEASTARKQLLTEAQIRGAVEAAFMVDDTGDFGRLILVLAATGARYSQVRAITVGDVQPVLQRILVPGSRKGRIAKAKPHAAIPISDAVLDRLGPALIDRETMDPLLERWAYRNIGPFQWERDHRRSWGPAYEIDKMWKACVAETGLPPGTVAYAFRHSSIVRGLTKGLPVRLVAALHDTSIEMIEAHYSAFITDATDELARRATLELP